MQATRWALAAALWIAGSCSLLSRALAPDACEGGFSARCQGNTLLLCFGDNQDELAFDCGDAVCADAQCGFCGDGIVIETFEACDDGNNADGDGCSADCLQLNFCGNGIIDPEFGEVCDDGNTLDGDLCSADCGTSFTCGDGFLERAAGELCDDGNFIDGDDCESNCTFTNCGDGFIDGLEECDFLQSFGQACSDFCLECGDNEVDPEVGEECDDGNFFPGDGCDENCFRE